MDKINPNQAMRELTMVLMYLSRFHMGRSLAEEGIFSAWKGYDFDVINDLCDEELIINTSNRGKSVYLTEEGMAYAQKLLEKYGIKDWQ